MLWPTIHAVADDARRGVRAVALEQRVEVGVIVGEPVAAVQPLALPVTTPVWRHHMPRPLECIDGELEAGRGIHPAMQHQQ